MKHTSAKLEETTTVAEPTDATPSKSKSKKRKAESSAVPESNANQYLVKDEPNEADATLDFSEIPGEEPVKRRKKKKKGKRVEAEEQELIEDIKIEEEHLESETENKQENGVIIDSWPADKIKTLLQRMRTEIPETDSMKYTSRIAKIDWNKVKFENYSASECEKMWKHVQKNSRCYPILEEIIADAEDKLLKSSSTLNLSLQKRKHPDQPPKPLSSYMLFFLDKKEKVQRENPGANGVELGKRVGELWKSLKPKKLDKYKNKAQKLKEEYDRKMSEFWEEHPECVEESKKKSFKGEPKKPPPNAYSLYIAEKAGRWKALDDSKKEKYAEKLKKIQEEYAEKYKEYINSLSPEEREEEESKMKSNNKKKVRNQLKVSIKGQNTRDAREGENVALECRFSPEIADSDTTYYWLRTNKKGQDNAAILEKALEPGYKLDFRPKQGRYDLLISNASFERDNGRFECRLKTTGSGRDLHSQTFVVTVLTPPGPPRIYPSPNPVATEGKPFELTCSSAGGSPEPVIKWFREDQNEIVDPVSRSTNQDLVTSAVLKLKPTRADDGAIYRCVVWNRAMPEGMKLETKVTLGVNYYPRVEVGPENPVRVEKEGSVTLQCNVDAKPRVSSVRWMRNDRFIATSFTHTINRVTLQDAGKYTCTADNGLGQVGVSELTLDVQYPPQVTIDGQGATRQRDAEEGESISIQCNVTANPPPITVEWLREGKPDFRQQGDTLKIHRATADSAGTYTCRAVNILNPSSITKQRSNRMGNASVTLLVRHKPGQARITPEKPIAMEGTGVTLTCSATPPGWPMPQYRWWRDEPTSLGTTSILATGSRYTIASVNLSSEGKYHCQVTNEMGEGEAASIALVVYQPPKFITKLQPHVTKKDGDYEFSVMCAAHGKPKPSIRWLKGNKEVSGQLFDTVTEESETSDGIHTVQSTLRFSGRERPNGNQLMPIDSGLYACIFENDVKRAESTMNLRVEHAPIVLHKYNKVAYDLHETAEVICKVQAYPRPEFQWSFSTNGATLMAGSDGHYEINTTVNESGGDIFTSVLQISNVREADYGEYHCKVLNTAGSTKATIRLQSKGSPEQPELLSTVGVGHNYVTLQWTPGFDGGVQNTRYLVAYRQAVKSLENEVNSDCFAPRRSGNGGDSWFEVDCQRNNPCNITVLDQHQAYTFKVKAYNSKGQSNFSDEISAITRVDRIPAPQRVTFDPESHVLSIYIAATCLQLVGKVETLQSRTHDANWQKIETIAMTPSGSSDIHREATILSLFGHRQTNGRSLDEDDLQVSSDGLVVEKPDDIRVRVRLCLMTDYDVCGEYTEAEVGPSYIKEASTIAMPTLIAITVSCVVFFLFIALVFVFCRCKRAHVKKSKAKDYEMDNSTVHPSIVQQPPPPYYSTPGLENKALEHSMDLVMDDASKNALYGGHAYSPYATNRPHSNGNEWVNMGYMENSYSNSNNGGSVNSQDSLWQMKMASAASNANSVSNDHPPRITDQVNHYGGYDPLTHGGYRTMDDYAHYPHITSASPDYSNHAPSHQDFASVMDKRNPRDPRLESPYHDVNGLPNPYMDHHQLMDGEENNIKQQPGQHLSISFDESLESGFSTPNSRNRRIIREIIV